MGSDPMNMRKVTRKRLFAGNFCGQNSWRP